MVRAYYSLQSFKTDEVIAITRFAYSGTRRSWSEWHGDFNWQTLFIRCWRRVRLYFLQAAKAYSRGKKRIRPESTIPICLDLGTNTQRYLDDPLYLGLRQNRVSEKEMDEFMDEFVEEMSLTFPKLMIQFEVCNHIYFSQSF